MCVMFFMSHYDGPREHCLGSYHCAHTDCPGTFEAHQKYLLEESRLDCSECLAKDGVQMDPDIVPVQYYPPIAHFEIQYVEGQGWIKPGEQGGISGTANARTTEKGEEEEIEDEDRYAHSFASLSDCDSVTSHWRVDPTFALPVPPTTTVIEEKSPSAPYQKPPTTEESYETRSPHEAHEMLKVREVSYEIASPEQEPPQRVCPESPFGDSPNTLEHRNLVNQQLATLEHRMACRQHRGQISQPTFDKRRAQRMNTHQRQNSKRRFDVIHPQDYTIPPCIIRGSPGPLPGGPDYENGLHYLVPATPVSGIRPDWRWGPVPAPHEMIQIPPGKPIGAVHTRRRPRRAQGPSKKRVLESDEVISVKCKG